MVAPGRSLQSAASFMRRLDREHVDQALALVFALVTELQVWLSASIGDRPQAAVAGLALSAAVGVRRRWPFGALVVGVASVSGEAAFGGTIAQHAIVAIPAAGLVFYGAGAFLERRRARQAFAVGVLGLLPQILITPHVGSDLFFEPVLLAFAPWAGGRYLRERSVQLCTVRELSERLDAERDQRVSAATGQERTRIAQELHDVVGHCLSVIVLQAGGARMLIGSEPARAEAALRVVERSGTEALMEMRRLLGVLAHGAGVSGSLAPQPGIGDIEALVQRTGAEGLITDLYVEGSPRPVIPTLGLCAYRIIQEALTNVIKHAGAARATVRVCWEKDRLELEVADDGRGPPTDVDPRIGRGLIGMRERAALHNGAVRAGAGKNGGYLVRASLSLAEGVP